MIHLFISSVKMFYKKWLILLEYGLLLTFPSACTGICKRTVFSGAFKLRTVVFASNCNSMNQSINQSINDKIHKNKHTFQSPFSKFMDTRLSEHCAPIIWFNCKHFLFVYIVKQKQKNFADFIKKCLGFFKSYGNRILLEANFSKFWSFINLL